MEFFDCIALEEAQRLIIDKVAGIATGEERIALDDALGRVAAADIFAADSLPTFSRSTVDGFAVRSADTFGAGEATPALLRVAGEGRMGQPTAVVLQSGEAFVIHTGGMLPAGADAVVMLEYTEQLDGDSVLVAKAVAPGENMVGRGDDLMAGSLLVTRGQVLAPRHIGLLAACGAAAVAVRPSPRVAVFSTGDELVDIDATPGPGQVRDINSYTVAAQLAEAGCIVARLGIIRDSYEDFVAALSAALGCYDMIILSGGSSVGTRDHTVRAVGSLGTPGVLFHGVAIKPGKPTIFGMVGATPIFGLPGHPVAAMIVCEQLVKRAVRVLLGQPPAGIGRRLGAVLARNVASAPGRDDYVNVRLRREAGRYVAEPLLGKSALITVTAQADGVVHIPAAKSGLYDGEEVEVQLFDDLRTSEG